MNIYMQHKMSYSDIHNLLGLIVNITYLYDQKENPSFISTHFSYLLLAPFSTFRSFNISLIVFYL